MPFLKAKTINEVRQEIIRAMSRIRPVTTGQEKDYIPTSFINLWNGGSRQKYKGVLYESYIGFLYELKGYNVEYRGIIKNGADGGIDLICRDGNCTVIAQCKNYIRVWNNTFRCIDNFCNVYEKYKTTHKEEKVFADFWIAAKIRNRSKFQNQDYPGLKIHDGFPIPEKIEKLKLQISVLPN